MNVYIAHTAGIDRDHHWKKLHDALRLLQTEGVSSPDAEPLLWGQDGDDCLTETDPDECIELIIDGYYPEPFEDIEDLTIYAYRPRTITQKDCGRPLERILEWLDEEYGNPEGPSGGTDAMEIAERAFIDTVVSEYRVWACEPTGESRTVNVMDWVKERRPDWLETTKDKA